MKQTLLVLAAILFIFSPLLKAQDSSFFSLDAQIRTRGEYRNGYKALPTELNKAALFVAQRTRLGVKYNTKKINISVEAQDVRAWGNDSKVTATGAYGTQASMNVYAAWAEIFLTKELSLKAGRQELRYDDGRLLAWRNWGSFGQTYDAALLKFKNENLSVDFGGSINNMSESKFSADYASSNFKHMGLAHLKYHINKPLSISGIYLLTGREQSMDTIHYLNTVGTNILYKHKNSPLYLRLSAYYQNGKINDSIKANAFLVGIEGGYKFGNFYAGTGLDYISGDNTNTTTTNEAFDLLYGARHKYSGTLNYYTQAKHTKFGGLINPYIDLKYKLNKTHKFRLKIHYFQLAQDVLSGTSGDAYYKKNLGEELDFTYQYKLTKFAKLQVGYSTYFATETLNTFKGVTDTDKPEQPNYVYIMLTLKPQLFSINK